MHDRTYTATLWTFYVCLLAACGTMTGCSSAGGGGGGEVGDPPGCANDVECNDGDDCTADSCDDGTCVNELIDDCPGPPDDVTADLQLGGGLGKFDMQAGIPSETRGTGRIDIGDLTAEGGSVELGLDAITVTPASAGPGKAGILQQGDAAFHLAVTFWIASTDELESVCGGGDEYGPFAVSLDESYALLSIEPSQVTFTERTLNLIDQGEFSICLRVEGDFDATVRISNLKFHVSGVPPESEGEGECEGDSFTVAGWLDVENSSCGEELANGMTLPTTLQLCVEGSTITLTTEELSGSAEIDADGNFSFGGGPLGPDDPECGGMYVDGSGTLHQSVAPRKLDLQYEMYNNCCSAELSGTLTEGDLPESPTTHEVATITAGVFDADWSGVSAALTDPSGDGGGVAGDDIIAVYIAQEDPESVALPGFERTFIRVDVANGRPSDDLYMGIGLNDDGSSDPGEQFIFVDFPTSCTLEEWDSTGSSHSTVSHCFLAVSSDTIEVAIYTRELELASSAYLSVWTDTGVEGGGLDSTDLVLCGFPEH